MIKMQCLANETTALQVFMLSSEAESGRQNTQNLWSGILLRPGSQQGAFADGLAHVVNTERSRGRSCQALHLDLRGRQESYRVPKSTKEIGTKLRLALGTNHVTSCWERSIPSTWLKLDAREPMSGERQDLRKSCKPEGMGTFLEPGILKLPRPRSPMNPQLWILRTLTPKLLEADRHILPHPTFGP